MGRENAKVKPYWGSTVNYGQNYDETQGFPDMLMDRHLNHCESMASVGAQSGAESREVKSFVLAQLARTTSFIPHGAVLGTQEQQPTRH